MSALGSRQNAAVHSVVLSGQQRSLAGRSRTWAACTRDRSTVRFGLLGPLSVSYLDRDVTPGAQKLRVLAATLLVRQGTVVPVDVLIHELWGDAPPRTALQALRVYVSQVRQVLARLGGGHGSLPMLVTQPPGYRLDVDARSLDVADFDRLCRLGQRAVEQHCPEAAVEQYRRALALWRGPALADVRVGPVLESAALRMEERGIAALKRRIDLDLRLHRHGDLVPELRGLTVEHPHNESLHARLMVALHRSGRTGDALGVYRCLRDLLVEDLGIEPSRQVQQVHQAILNSDHQAIEQADLWTL